MPTYQNRSGQIVSFGEYQFAPFETKKINKNIYHESPVFQVSEDPKYIPYETIIKSGTTSSTSKIFIHNHSFVIKVDDGFPEDHEFYDYTILPAHSNDNNSLLKLGIYATVGPQDVEKDAHLARIIYFVKNYGTWLSLINGFDVVPQQLIDIYYELVFIRILAFSGQGTVDISIKPY